MIDCLYQGDTPKDKAEKAPDPELAAYLGNRQHYQMIQREDQETTVWNSIISVLSLFTQPSSSSSSWLDWCSFLCPMSRTTETQTGTEGNYVPNLIRTWSDYDDTGSVMLRCIDSFLSGLAGTQKKAAWTLQCTKDFRVFWGFFLTILLPYTAKINLDQNWSSGKKKKIGEQFLVGWMSGSM